MRIEANRKRNASAASRLARHFADVRSAAAAWEIIPEYFFAASFRWKRPVKQKSLSVLSSPAGNCQII